jgi:hypothetical protein
VLKGADTDYVMISAFRFIPPCLLLLSLALNAEPLATQVSYQGYLSDNGEPANGIYDLRLALHSAPEGSASVAPAVTNANVAIINGVFTTSLDFGEAALGGNALWLEVGVRLAGSEDSWVILAPRQRVHSTPYSILSLSAMSVADGSVTGSKIAGGTVEAHHLKEGAIGQQQLAEGAVVHSVNELSGPVAIVGEGQIRVSTIGSTVVLEANLSGVDEVARFEVVTRDGPPRGFDTLSEALAALEDHSILRIRGDCEVAAAQVWAGNWPSVAGIPITGRRHLRIQGINNPVIRSSSFGDFLYLRDCRDVTVEGITFDGAGTDATSVSNPYAALVNLGGENRDIVIRDCTFQDFQGHGVSHLFGSKTSVGVRIENNRFERLGNSHHPRLGIDGAAVSGIGSDWVVTKNTIRDCLRGIEIEGPGPAAQRNILITENTLHDIWNVGIMLFASSGDSSLYSDITVSGNMLTGKSPRPEGVPYQSGISFAGGERIALVNNHVRDFPDAFVGIFLSSGMADVRDSAVTGNIVANVGGRGIQVFQQQFLCEHVIVARNQVRATGHNGIWISGTGHIVSGNIIRSGNRAGVEVSSNSRNLNLMGNTCAENAAEGIRVLVGAKDVMIQGNVLLQNSGGSILDDGTDTVMANNWASP